MLANPPSALDGEQARNQFLLAPVLFGMGENISLKRKFRPFVVSEQLCSLVQKYALLNVRLYETDVATKRHAGKVSHAEVWFLFQFQSKCVKADYVRGMHNAPLLQQRFNVFYCHSACHLFYLVMRIYGTLLAVFVWVMSSITQSHSSSSSRQSRVSDSVCGTTSFQELLLVCASCSRYLDKVQVQDG